MVEPSVLIVNLHNLNYESCRCHRNLYYAPNEDRKEEEKEKKKMTVEMFIYPNSFTYFIIYNKLNLKRREKKRNEEEEKGSPLHRKFH
jgi:hypothetical protein